MVAATQPSSPPTPQDLDRQIVILRDVVVSFDGFRALNIDAFGVDRNELRVVIGPNGAGKTTLCDVISGKTPVTSGKVYFDRVETTHLPDVEIARLGVGRKFQTPTVFDSLTVYDNMILALPGRRNVWTNLHGRETPAQRDAILTILDRVHLLPDVATPAKYLSHGQLKGRHTIIVIEHDMDFVRRLDSRITVLNEGQRLAEGSLDQVQADPAVIEAYLGR
jgi:urea transport system ATP-binding protein